MSLASYQAAPPRDPSYGVYSAVLRTARKQILQGPILRGQPWKSIVAPMLFF